MTDGTTTARVDASGHLIASVAATGRLATDPLGNAYVAAIASTTLTIDKYGPPLALLWHATAPVAANSRMRAIAGRAGGGVTVAVGVPLDNTTQALRFTPAGALESSIAVTGTAAATDGELTITTWSDSGSLRFAAYDATGAVQWTRAFAGSATITAMAIDPAHRLVFGGELLTSIDFGGGPLRLVETDDGPINGFVAELSSTGAHVFSTRIGVSTVAGVATNGPRIAVSGTTRTQFFYKQLVVFDADHPPSIDIGQLSDNGRGGPVAMSPSGRVWWTFEEQFQLFTGFGGSAGLFFKIDAGTTPTTRADVEEVARKLTAESRFLGDVSPSFWWPEDRRWFVATPEHMSTTYLGGSRCLVDRLLADGRLEAFPAEASDDHGPAERHEEERRYGPVIATGSEGGRPWSLRGRIGSDGVWTSLDGGGGGGGMLPFQRTETGLETRYLGSLGTSGPGWPGQRCSVNGVVAPAAATVEARLEDGSVIPTRLVDVGDERARFFVAVWSGAPCTAVVARDPGGGELETKAFRWSRGSLRSK